VAKLGLMPRRFVAAVAAPGRHGRRVGGPRPVVLTERQDVRLCVVAARRGKAAEVAEVVRSLTRLTQPPCPKRVVANGLGLVGTAPDQWLAVAAGKAASERLARLVAALAGLATTVEQSDGKAVIRVAGPRARAALAMGCSLDLDPRAFASGDAATTPIALIDCTLWQVDDAPTYDLAVPSSFAESFWSWLTGAAAEYGYEVVSPGSRPAEEQT
jgi:heterotetrameric sarcosine oxidase gamma subunit